MYEKQVHVFGETGAPVWVIRCTHLGKQVHPFWRISHGGVHTKKAGDTIVPSASIS